jgi:hypothetical protein
MRLLRHLLLVLVVVSGCLASFAGRPANAHARTQVPDIHLLMERAANGDAEAQYRLGVQYLTGLHVDRDFAQAVLWLTRASDQNYSAAEVTLGRLYLSGQGVPYDPQKAEALIRRAADARNVQGLFALGEMYALGLGVKSDFEKEVGFYKAAAELGNAWACFQMGVFYEHGHGVPENSEEARHWFERSAKAGNEQARLRLAGLMQGVGNSAPDQKKSFEEVRKLAKKGNSEAAFQLGYAYAKGLGVTRDLIEAQKWFAKGASTGLQLVELGDLYAEGSLLPRDDKRAIQLYEAAGSVSAAKLRIGKCTWRAAAFPRMIKRRSSTSMPRPQPTTTKRSWPTARCCCLEREYPRIPTRGWIGFGGRHSGG